MHWKIRGRTLDLGARGLIAGVLNVTPDSFSDGGRFLDPDAALAHARAMLAEGADIVDVGGESTRPNAAPVAEVEEINRTRPVVAAIANAFPGVAISIDTSKSAVARAAIEAGAAIVNDVSGLRGDAEMAAAVVETGAGVVIMHMQGTPRDMQRHPRYRDVVREVRDFFAERFAFAMAAGIDPEAVVFDPGIGFGKTLEHNLALLAALAELSVHGRPLMLGVSRKSFIARILESDAMGERDWPTVALTSFARERGVAIHRVHAVAPNLHALRMTEAILGEARTPESCY